jgi:5'(3')-deoxyribonucleotidase
MYKKVLAVDIDEVLFPFTPTFLAYHNAAYQTQLTLAHKQSDFLEHITGETEDQMCAKIDAYLKTPFYAHAGPLPDAVGAIRRLSKSWRLVIITARTPNYRGSTELFIERHFPGMFSGIFYSCDAHDPKKITPKHSLCQQVGAYALVDDSLRNLQTVADVGVHGVLFGNYPWNQRTPLPKRVTRCKDWGAVESHLKAHPLGSARKAIALR